MHHSAVEVNLPFSKSLSNRWLVLRKLSGERFDIEGLSDSTDTFRLAEMLDAVGPMYDAGDGGTTFRFLLAYLSLKDGVHQLTGSNRIGERPMTELINGLRQLGATIDVPESGSILPLTIHGGNLRGGIVTLDGSRSSQFISSLLLIAPFLPEPLTLDVSGKMVSGPYIEMTLSVLTQTGVKWKREGSRLTVWPTKLNMKKVVIERDWSSAAFFFQYCALVPGSNLRFPGLRLSGLQGDEKACGLYALLGVQSYDSDDGVVIRHVGRSTMPDLLQVDLTDCPDIMPSLVMACAGLRQRAEFVGIGHLRHKESDRLEVLAGYLRAAGCDVFTTQESLTLNAFPEKFLPLEVDPFNDHRIAMCMAVFSTADCQVTVHDSDTVSKSFPDFWKYVSHLEMNVIRD